MHKKRHSSERGWGVFEEVRGDLKRGTKEKTRQTTPGDLINKIAPIAGGTEERGETVAKRFNQGRANGLKLLKTCASPEPDPRNKRKDRKRTLVAGGGNIVPRHSHHYLRRRRNKEVIFFTPNRLDEYPGGLLWRSWREALKNIVVEEFSEKSAVGGENIKGSGKGPDYWRRTSAKAGT